MVAYGVVRKWLEKNIGQPIELVVVGRPFGSKPGDVLQLVEGSCAEDGVLRLKLELGVVLEVENPGPIRIGQRGQLEIEKATEARLGWYFFGRPRTPESWCTERYTVVGDKVEHEVGGAASHRFDYLVQGDVPFVELA